MVFFLKCHLQNVCQHLAVSLILESLKCTWTNTLGLKKEVEGLTAATLKFLGKSSFFTTEWQMRQ